MVRVLLRQNIGRITHLFPLRPCYPLRPCVKWLKRFHTKEA